MLNLSPHAFYQCLFVPNMFLSALHPHRVHTDSIYNMCKRTCWSVCSLVIILVIWLVTRAAAACYRNSKTKVMHSLLACGHSWVSAVDCHNMLMFCRLPVAGSWSQHKTVKSFALAEKLCISLLFLKCRCAWIVAESCSWFADVHSTCYIYLLRTKRSVCSCFDLEFPRSYKPSLQIPQYVVWHLKWVQSGVSFSSEFVL